MRKWDGEPTSKLSAWVHELRGKRPGKKGLPKKTISVVAPERPEDTQQSPRYEKTKTISYNPDEGTSDLASQRSDSNTLTRNRNGGSLPLARRRRGMTGYTGLYGFDDLAHWIHRSTKL